MSSEEPVKPFHAKSDQDAAQARGQEAAEAVAAVLKHAAERDEAGRKKTPPKPRAKWALPLGLNLSVLALYLLIAPPAWVTLDPIPPPAPESQIESFRVALWLQARRIEAYRVENGRLPGSLHEAGTPVPGVDYVVSGNEFVLVGSLGETVVQYDSTQPNDDIVAAAAARLAGG
jgi:hypothetical protein